MSYTIIKDPALGRFHISKDAYCYTVVETITPDEKNLESGSKGKAYEKPVGHYGKLSHALAKIAKGKVDRKTEYNSVISYIKEYEKERELMNELLNKLEI